MADSIRGLVLALGAAAAVACGGSAASKQAGAAPAAEAASTRAPAPARHSSTADSMADAPAPPPSTAGMPAMAPTDDAPRPAGAGRTLPQGHKGQGQQGQGQQARQGSTQKGAQPAAAPARNLMLIYTANLTLAVFEAVEGLDKVETLAIDAGGYLVRRTDNSITVRVPAGDFRGLLEEVSKIGDELHRDVNVRDVTAEFRDLQTQLVNLSAVRDRLQALLARAKNVPEALQVERELTRVTGQIEQIKGRMKLYRELVAFSTITVTFQAQPVEKVASTVKLPFPWLDQLGLSRLLDLR